MLLINIVHFPCLHTRGSNNLIKPQLNIKNLFKSMNLKHQASLTGDR